MGMSQVPPHFNPTQGRPPAPPDRTQFHSSAPARQRHLPGCHGWCRHSTLQDAWLSGVKNLNGSFWRNAFRVETNHNPGIDRSIEDFQLKDELRETGMRELTRLPGSRATGDTPALR
jgi:hypothetical protein